MNRIDARFRALGEADQTAFIPFFTAGDPSLETTGRLLHEAEGAGADLIELGFPYSDPIADGPTIQDSYHRALERDVRVDQVFDVVAGARSTCTLPIVAMISYSLVFRMGMETFLDRASRAGLDGATIPDLPVEEALKFLDAADERDFRLICFVTPATARERRQMVVRSARGFIYYIAVRGITGERSGLPEDLVENIRSLKELTSVPVAVGFGISRPVHARAVARQADGVIVGSAIVRRMAAAAENEEDPVKAARDFIREMAAATHGG